MLIEGPRDATPLIPFLLSKKTRMPVAIYTTYVRRVAEGLPERHSATYPLCDFSPELAAMRAGAEVGARTRFVDLTFPEMVVAGRRAPSAKAESLLEERGLRHARFLRAACERAGARDPDDLWDQLYECTGTARSDAAFFRDVLAYGEAARQDYTDTMLRAEGMLARESAMAAAISEETAKDTEGPVVVVVGAFHAPAVLSAKPALPKPLKIASDDALVVLMRYGFPQLDRLNGYASGMPSPGFYQHLWEGRPVEELVTGLGRATRALSTSTADVIAAAVQTRRLAGLRGHDTPSREDLLDGVRSALVKGSLDVEGVAVLAAARKLLAGDLVGRVPEEAGVPPIVLDFAREGERLGIETERLSIRELSLDLYRRAEHREISRFLFRLSFLGVPFGERVRGPNFVSGEDLERVEEGWVVRWRPDTEGRLIECSVYGSTVREAAAARLLETLADAQTAGMGRRSEVAASLLVEACRMGLHHEAPDVLARTAELIQEDGAFPSVVKTLEALLLLLVSQEVLEAHRLEGLPEIALRAFERACYLLPDLSRVAAEGEDEALDALLALQQAELTLSEIRKAEGSRELLLLRLRELEAVPSGNPLLGGAAAGSLFAEGRLPAADLGKRLSAHLSSSLGSPAGLPEAVRSDRPGDAAGTGFLRGVLRASRNVLWQVPEVLESVHQLIASWDEAGFLGALPRLRLAFSVLSPRETDRLGHLVASRTGFESLEPLDLTDVSEADLYAGLEVDRRLRETLTRDGLLEAPPV
ncbi:MAG: hypothetical protein JNK60_23435 [Acidobacteria bacterium]|nr:hypothetical protein [Acidobacteriota bacterium]